MHNAFDFRSANHRIYVVVYDSVSRINHSCIPNAYLEILSASGNPAHQQGQARLIASQPIRNGAEIFVNYITNDWLNDGATRRQVLQTNWGFACTCTACQPTNPLQVGMDDQRRALARTHQASLIGGPAPANATELSQRISDLDHYIRLLRTLGKLDGDLSRA